MTQKDILQTESNQGMKLDKAPSPLRALVLADASQVDDFPTDTFEQAGCVATYAATLEEARLQLQKAHPVIVFFSLTLAGESTLHLLDRCKSLSPQPYAIVVASHDQINDAAEAMHAGAFDCLFKPFSTSRLSKTIRDLAKICRQHDLRPKLPPLTGKRSTGIVNKRSKTLGSSSKASAPAPRPVPAPVPAPVSAAVSTPVVNIGSTAPLTFPQKTQTAINEDKRPTPGTTPPSVAPLCAPKAREKLIGKHIAFASALRLLDSIAPSAAPVFLRGEIGTGKELFARAVHEVSGREADKFVIVDCASLRADTLASEMFGHLYGSIPGASSDKLGMSHFANGGTMYFDEISNLDLRVQSQLVRFVQSGEILRVGEDTPTKVDIRLITSTSSDPLQLIEDGALLKDLYYQLHVAPISLPPLRSRGEDIAHLAHKFLIDYAASEARDFSTLAEDALQLLRGHHWPGNVHELKSTIWSAVLQNNGTVLTAEMLPPMLRFPHQMIQSSRYGATGIAAEHLIGRSLAEIEQIVIEETIRANGGSVPKAARILEVSPSTLYRKRETWQH